MKLSNKILIGFFGFIFIYMAAAFTELKFRGTPNRISDSIAKVEFADIKGVSHLILADLDESIIIKGSSEKPRIELLSLSGEMLQKLTYNISGDTLTLVGLDIAEDESVNFYIYLPKDGLTGITVNGAGVVIEDLDQTSLSIIQKNGWVRMDETNHLKNLLIEASEEAYLDIKGFNLDTLSVTMDDSRVNLHSTTKHVKGTLYNDSHLELGEANEIAIKKDSTSVLRIF